MEENYVSIPVDKYTEIIERYVKAECDVELYRSRWYEERVRAQRAEEALKAAQND